jgi:hypothetical protein
MSAMLKPACLSSVTVNVPALTEIRPAHAPTGILLERVSNRKEK